jgi:hypothetical protein
MSWDENFFDNVEVHDIELDVDGNIVSLKIPILQPVFHMATGTW